MNYVFPLYWRPAFLVHLPGEYANYRMIVCLLVDGATNKILSYSITFGEPAINIFRTSLVKCNEGLLFTSARALQPDCRNHIIRLDNDSLKSSLTSVRRSRSLFNSDFERRWLRSFYDWHLHRNHRWPTGFALWRQPFANCRADRSVHRDSGGRHGRAWG